MLPNTAHTLQFTPSRLWSPTHTMHLQHGIFRLQYSTERICAAIGDISTMPSSIYCKPGAKCSAPPPVNAMWTVVPYIYKAFTAPNIQDSIYNSTYLPCYRRYLDNSMLVILQTWCQRDGTSSTIRHANCGPGHIECNYSTAYSGFSIQQNVSALLLEIYWPFNARYTANVLPNTAHIVKFTLCKLCSRTYTI
jgi:hypothetical protein